MCPCVFAKILFFKQLDSIILLFIWDYRSHRIKNLPSANQSGLVDSLFLISVSYTRHQTLT